jgi:hypothetical protein
MWLPRKYCYRRTTKFFRITFRYDSLKNYFETNFALMQHHKYNLEDIEHMMPWEKNIYVTLLVNYIKEENEKLQQQKALNKR